jgi:ATP-binding cassette subfamily B protein
MMVFFSNLSMVIVLYLGGRQTMTFTISPGDFVAFISYIGLLTWPMMAMGWVTNLIQRGKASLDRIDRILSTAPEIVDRPDARPLPRAVGQIRFESVSFTYPGVDNRALTDVDVSIAAGSTLGIVGPPGSGKSTLLSLVVRRYDPQNGKILLDGEDIRNLRLSDLHRQIIAVPQEPFLFTGTLRENILAGRQASDDALHQAAQEAALLDTVEEFSDGFDTLVGEKGVMLSGGQKQRVALARALLRNAPVMLLDDPISQVDTDTGTRIVEILHRMAGQRTLIIVSHRLSALRFADRILVMAEGKIAEAGTHADLAVSGGFYGRTFQLQRLEEEF